MSEENQLKSCKVVLVGESGVGKTCITSNFMNEEFKNDIAPTTAASFFSKTIRFNETNNSIKFDIWDTAGQEIYRSLAKIFYKDASVAILVYDITNRKSFEEIKKYWYFQIKEHAPNANKSIYYNIIFLKNSIGIGSK
jgi:Ras-related protein Rab-22